MKVKIYANYGVLAHEKEAVYTASAPCGDGTAYDELIVNIPDRFKPCKLRGGDIGVDIDGMTYSLHQVLFNRKDNPGILWFDGASYHFAPLEVLEYEGTFSTNR